MISQRTQVGAFWKSNNIFRTDSEDHDKKAHNWRVGRCKGYRSAIVRGFDRRRDTPATVANMFYFFIDVVPKRIEVLNADTMEFAVEFKFEWQMTLAMDVVHEHVWASPFGDDLWVLFPHKDTLMRLCNAATKQKVRTPCQPITITPMYDVDWTPNESFFNGIDYVKVRSQCDVIKRYYPSQPFRTWWPNVLFEMHFARWSEWKERQNELNALSSAESSFDCDDVDSPYTAIGCDFSGEDQDLDYDGDESDVEEPRTIFM